MSHEINGCWKLQSWQLHSDDGELFEPFGAQPQGYLIYLPGGIMSVHLAKSDRQPFASDEVFSVSEQEAQLALTEYASYAGTYELDGDEVVHHIELMSIPNWIGKSKRRQFAISNDQLQLAHKLLFQGSDWDSKLIWQRVALV